VCHAGSSTNDARKGRDHRTEMVIDEGGFMHDQQRGALRLVHPVSDQELVNRERGSRILAIAEQPHDNQRATRESVVDRVLRVLAVVADGPHLVNLSQLAEQTGLPLSTTHRLAKQLIKRGALHKDDQGHYGVGPALLAIASHTVHDDSDS
jgi:IclR helix-turn-helix domain